MSTGRQPIPNQVTRKFREGSSMRDDRDGDSLGQQWLKSQAVGAQAGHSARAVANVQRQLDRLRSEREPVPWPSLHPFEVYQLPGEENTDLWRVHYGRVWMRPEWDDGTGDEVFAPSDAVYNRAPAQTDQVYYWTRGGVANPYQVVQPGAAVGYTSSNSFTVDAATYGYAATPGGALLYILLHQDTEADPAGAPADLNKLYATVELTSFYSAVSAGVDPSLWVARVASMSSTDGRWEVEQYLKHDYFSFPLPHGSKSPRWAYTRTDADGSMVYNCEYNANRIYYPYDLAAYQVGANWYAFQKHPNNACYNQLPTDTDYWTSIFRIQ